MLLGALLAVAGPSSQASADPTLTGCNLASNPVACENQLPGTPRSTWIESGAGDLSVQGFATDQSVDIGQTINFKINTPADTWHVDIVRVGWYNGLGGRIVAAGIQPAVTTAQNQPPCLVDTSNTTGLVDCGNWSVSASWTVPSDAVSGIYVAHLVRDDTDGGSLIQFTVRNDASHSNIVYQTSDVTREAYNQYGGNSVYECSVACPPGNPLVYKAAYKVSFNRPNTAALLGGQYSFFESEEPMVQFLEENGYDLSYISGVDTDRYGAALLTNHKMFMDSGHDEYWSGAQRTNVTAARDAGVNLAFFSGNESFWKIRYEAGMADSTPDRTLVTYKETHFNAPTDPQDPPTWTGNWRDGRFSPPADGGQPENALTGQIYMVNSPAAFAIQVPGTYAGLRFWRNTSVAQLSASQTATLAPDTLGYEFDEDLDNGFRPAGEIDMSSTTVSVQNLVQDYYDNVEGPGTVTHHLSLYKATSGALVFGAGTVQWALGLEPNGLSTVSTDQQQATINLLADMGAQPTTLMPGRVAATASADVTPPVSSITSPAAGARESNGSTVTVSGTAADTGGGVVAGVEVSTDGGTTWHPATIAAASASTTWSYSWNVTGDAATTIKTRASDDSGNVETPSAGVIVNAQCPCQIFASSAVPKVVDSGDATAAELGVKFTSSADGWVTGLRFYKAATNTGTHVGDLWTVGGQLLGTATFNSETASGWQQVTFPQAVHVTANTVYVASYHTNVGHESDDTGAFSGRTVASPPLTALESSTDTSATVNVSGPNGVFSLSASPTFPTSAFQDSNYYVDVTFQPSAGPPVVISQSPQPGAVNQSTVGSVTATFTEDVVPSSISFTLTGPGNQAVPATSSYSSATDTASLTPNSPLATGTTYTATISGVTDSQGRTLSAPVSWSFTTFSCPCSLWSNSTTPVIADSSDPNPVELGLQFSSSVNGYISGVRFYKGPTNTGPHIGSLWTSTGTLLAQATFQGETASGWQQLSFQSPVPITAGTIYVVSYDTSVGSYATDPGYFLGSSVSNGPLTALGGGLNGLFTYGSSPTFPTSSFDGTNYWVDPVFVTQTAVTSAPTVTSVSPKAGAGSVATNTVVTATLSEAVQPSSVAFTLTGPTGPVAGTLAYNVGTFVATFTPSAPLVVGASYTATVSGATDLQGHPMAAPFTWSFSTGVVLTSLQVTPAGASVPKGKAQQYTATGTYSDGTTQNLSAQAAWTSSNTAVASVTSPGGMALGLALGSTTIGATVSGITGSVTLTVIAPVLMAIQVTPAAASIAKGKTQQYTATGTYSDGTTQNLSAQAAWTSSNTAVAKITTPGGLATALAVGSTTIAATVTAISGSVTLTVTAPTLTAIQVSPATASVSKGTNVQYAATGTYSDGTTQTITTQVVWTTSNSSVAKITSPGGLATTVGMGTATITATLAGVKASAVVTVTAPLVFLLVLGGGTLPKGQSQQLAAWGIFADGRISNVTALASWSSSNTSVATVTNPGGLATAVNLGTSIITATLTGLSWRTQLTVTKPVLTSMQITPANATQAHGTTKQMTATGTYSDGTTANLTTQVQWTSSNVIVATFTRTAGALQANKVGTVKVTASLGSISASTNVTVT
jgi:hypothetical protein